MPDVMIVRSDDDGLTWSDPEVAIEGGKHPTIAIAQDGAFYTVVVAAYVGPDGGPGTITARVQHSGDVAFSDPFTLGGVGNVADDTFHIQQAHDDQSRWMLHALLFGAAETSHFTSYDEARTWERVS